MLTQFECFIALRYLKTRKKDSAVTTIALFSLAGITLGVMTLIVVLSVMRGVRMEMINSIIGLEGHVTAVAANSRSITDFEPLVDAIKGVEGITGVTPLVQGQVMLSFQGAAVGALATGIRADDLKEKPLLADDLDAQAMQQFADGQGILIGSRIAQRYGIRTGDSVTLISPEGRATPAGMVPRIQAYPVAGIFEIGMYAYDNGAVFMPFEKAQVFFKLADAEGPGRISKLEIMSDDADGAASLAQDIANVSQGTLRTYDWQRSNQQLFNAVLVQRNVMFLILMLIIIVASFNIISSLIMLVRQKRKDIAILRTIGASRQQVRRIFMLLGCLVAGLGIALGTCLGLIISYNSEEIQAGIESLTGQKLLTDELYFLSSLPAEVSLVEVAMVAGITMTLAFIASLLPARSAAMLQPSNVLRGE